MPRLRVLCCLVVAVLCQPGRASATGALDFPSTWIEQMGAFPQISPISGMASILNPNPRTYMTYIHPPAYASQLTEPVRIVGMQFRLAMGTNWRLQTPPSYTANTWPNVDVLVSQYSITMGRAIPLVEELGGFSTGQGVLIGPFDDYMTNPTVVRSGPMLFPANSFVASGGANGVHAWGPVVHFDQPYVFTPGESLVYVVRHSGVENAGSVVPALFASRYRSPNTADGMLAFSHLATVPVGLADIQYVRWVTEPIPEPSGLATVAGVWLLTARRRRRPAIHFDQATRPAA